MASLVVNPAGPNFQKRASVAQMRSEANGRFAAQLRKIHVDHSLANISHTNMARYIELDPERSSQRGLPVVMTKEEWKAIQPQLGTEPVNVLFRRTGALQGNVPPLAPRRPKAQSPSERAHSVAELKGITPARSANMWRSESGYNSGPTLNNGSSGAPRSAQALSLRAPRGAVSNASAAALQAGLGNYPNSPRAGDPAGAASSSRAQSRLTLNSPAGSFGATSNVSRKVNAYNVASSTAFRQNWIKEAQRRAATRGSASGTGGKRKTRRQRK
jgi:hypothetical protein